MLPVGWLAWQSIYHDGFTLENYRRILSEDIYWRSFLLTFEVSLLVTLLALLLGYPLAYAAHIAPKGWSVVILALVILPFWTSVLVRAYAWLALLQRTGVDQPAAAISRHRRGAPGARPQYLRHRRRHVAYPVALHGVAALRRDAEKFRADLMQAGASLGAGPAHAFRRIFLPLSLPGVLAGSTLVFVLCLGFYITPELLGGGRTLMVSMLVSRNVELYDQWGAASAVGVVLLVSVSIIFFVVSRFIPLDRVLETR